MNIAVEIIVSLLLIAVGYIAVYLYLHKISLKNLSFEKVIPKGKNKIGYILIAVISFAILIVLFNTVYLGQALLHQLKLLLLLAVILPAAAVDFKVHKIPNAFIITAVAARLLIYIPEFIVSVSDAFSTLKGDLIGAFIIGAFFLLILLVFKNSIGMGDIKLFMTMGLYQGLWGAVNSIFFSLLVSFFLSIALLVLRKKGRKDAISFGPSILVGSIIAISLSGM